MQKRTEWMKLDKIKAIEKYYFIIISVLVVSFVSCNRGENHHRKFGKIIEKQHDSIHVQWNAEYSDKIDQWFKNLYSATRFNGNVLVAKDGKVIYENSYGYANFARKDTMTLSHRFQIASLSKTFTSMAILILKERGLLSLDDDVKKYIKGFPYDSITIRELLSHRSGLPNYNYFCDQYTDKETVIFNNDVIRLMIDSVPGAYYPPNTRFDYCNTNYVLLASIIENITGKNFVDFMRDEIFDKAGMHSTHIFIKGKQDRIYKAATGYLFKWEVALPIYQDGVYGDKGIYTTLADLWRWNLALEQNKLVSQETLQEAFIAQSHEKKGNSNYGLGWRLHTMADSSELIYHTGWWRGFNSLFVKDIKNSAVYIILSNIHTRALQAHFQELLGIIDPERKQKQVLEDSLYVQRKNLIDTTKVGTGL